jgi:hypothetical protein
LQNFRVFREIGLSRFESLSVGLGHAAFDRNFDRNGSGRRMRRPCKAAVLDVSFREDDCRVRKDHAAQNRPTPRKFALVPVS